MPTDSLKIAAAYVRVSTEDQTEYSPDAQLRLIKEYAASHGYILPDQFVYMDEGITGRKTDKRAAFNRMIGTAKKKPRPFDAILLWKFSRFARSREDSVVYKSMLRKQLGIDVVSITEPVGDDKMSVLIEALIEAMDEYYSINLAEEVKKGMTEKARRGGLQSNPSFGYTVEDNKLIPIEAEAALVREIFDRFIAGEGLFPIARWLNEQGIRTRRGNRFENRTVEYIIRNPAYIGKLRWNPSGRTRRDFKNENIILADAAHEPLISTETWEAAQQRMEIVKAQWSYKARPTDDLKDWPSGIVRCASCGATLIYSRPHYYKCNNYARGACKISQHVRADLLKEAIMTRLEEDMASSLPLSVKITYTQERGGDELQRLGAVLETLNKKKLRLRDAYLSGVDTVEEYRSYKESIESELSAVQTRIAEIEKQSEKINVTATLKDAVSKALQTLHSPIATTEDKHNAVLSVIESCTYNKSENVLSIVYRVIF